MKQRIRRTAAFLLALFMSVSLTQYQGSAVLEGVYFTGVNDKLMPLTGETMPFYSGNILYICQTIFEKTDLGVRYIRNYTFDLAVLYTPDTGLYFDLYDQSAQDSLGNEYQSRVIEKNGMMFFPAELVCRFFGLNLSVTETATVPLVRITNNAAFLDDISFINAAASMMASRYAAYEKQVKDSQNDSGNGNTEQTPSDDPSLKPPPVHAADGQKVYLLLSSASGESIRKAMQVLSGSSATFLLTAQQLEDGELVRALLGNGHAIALKLQSSTEDELRSELLRARGSVWQASCSLLQLVWYEGKTDISELLLEYGCVGITPDLDCSDIPLRSEADAETMLRQIGKHRENLSVRIGAAEDCLDGLDDLLAKLINAQYRLCALRLTH